MKESLEDYVKKWLMENGVGAAREAVRGGCCLGNCPGLTRYDETIPFYDSYKHEINRLVSREMSERGISSLTQLIPGWDTDDPLVLNNANKNALAWFAFERTLEDILGSLDRDDIEICQDLILSFIENTVGLSVFNYKGTEGEWFEARSPDGYFRIDTCLMGETILMDGWFFGGDIELDIYGEEEELMWAVHKKLDEQMALGRVSVLDEPIRDEFTLTELQEYLNQGEP